GKRAFVGNSGMAAPGRKVPKASLVAVLSAAPRRKKAHAGEAWLGSPPAPLRRTAEAQDTPRTHPPPPGPPTPRPALRLCRLVPAGLGVALYAAVALTLLAIADQTAWWVALLVGGPVLAVAGALAAGVTVAAKWLLVGRIRPGGHPLWSSFVWRNELADTFTEMLAAPWFASVTQGTAALNAWLRTLGARIGKGVWGDTYWLPEPALVELQAG